jgi:rubrerythrin
MPLQPETVARLFDQAIELEKSAERLYRRFGEWFADYPVVATFWKHYADEEKGHAAYLERVLTGVDASRLAKPANANMLRAVRDCLAAASLDRLGGIQTLEDAFQLATELENSETNTIFEFIVMNFSTEELAQSHKFLRAQLSSHITKLQDEFPSEYQNAAARRNVMARNVMAKV